MSDPAFRGLRRRDFLKRLGAGAAAFAATPAALALLERMASADPGARPNILLIMSDEHNPFVLGAAGNALARTPNLDKLAARGVLFDNCYTNSPLCVPARLAFTSGKYPSRIGGWSNSCWIEDDRSPSIARAVNAAGYESFLCGKMHYDASRRYGFTEIGGNMNGAFMGGAGGRLSPDLLGRPAPRGMSDRFKEFRAFDRSSIIRHDQAVTAGTTKFLADRKAADKPFFLVSGFLAPHFPLIVPKAFYDHFAGRVPMPEIPAGHLEGLPRNYRALRRGFAEENVPPETVKLGRELYYAFVEWIDAEIGKVLDALAASPFADNTVVIYTSDHGENMGEHGMWWKSTMFENSARVPLIVSYAKRWKGGQRRKGACSLVDVTGTIADVAGGTLPADVNGTSLTGWLDNPNAAWKDVAVSEYFAHNICSGFVMLRAGKWKYVYHTAIPGGPAAERELYDLDADPKEFANLAKDGRHEEVMRDLHARLVKETGEEPDRTEIRARADLAKGYGRKATGKAAPDE